MPTTNDPLSLSACYLWSDQVDQLFQLYIVFLVAP